MENSVSVNETAVMNSIKNGMKNLLFIEGNRSEIDKANVVESYNKIKAMGFIPTMPVEFLPIEQAQNKLGGRRLLKPVLKREKGKVFLLSVISKSKWKQFQKVNTTYTMGYVSMGNTGQ